MGGRAAPAPAPTAAAGELRTRLRVMGPARTCAAAGGPSSKVKYSVLPSSDGRHTDCRKETAPAEGCSRSKRRPGGDRSHSLKFKKSPTRIPYKAVGCAALQFLLGALLLLTGCLLLGGCVSKVGPARAVAILIVGVLVLLPGFYHLLVACRAQRGCSGYSFQDLPDCGD